MTTDATHEETRVLLIIRSTLWSNQPLSRRLYALILSIGSPTISFLELGVYSAVLNVLYKPTARNRRNTALIVRTGCAEMFCRCRTRKISATLAIRASLAPSTPSDVHMNSEVISDHNHGILQLQHALDGLVHIQWQPIYSRPCSPTTASPLLPARYQRAIRI